MMNTEVEVRTTRWPGSRRWTAPVALVLAAALVLMAGYLLVGLKAAAGTTMPQSSEMESALGIRFSRVAVVGDGGLVTLSYVVLDQEKAFRFQTDVEHPPSLHSEERTGGTHRVSLMRQGHNLRAGQTYYLVFQNTAGAIRAGELADIEYGSMHLRHVPVL
jgi:hypothetical protein